MTVDELINGILAREGGYSDRPDDHGGPTNRGITQATLSRWLGHNASKDDVQNLTEGDARAIYRQNFYDDPHMDRLPDDLAPVVVDMGVNSGPRAAIRLLQQALMDAGYPVTVDGILGTQTTNAAANAYQNLQGTLVNNIVARREQYYQNIVQRDPSQAVFLPGWLNRATSFIVAEPTPNPGPTDTPGTPGTTSATMTTLPEPEGPDSGMFQGPTPGQGEGSDEGGSGDQGDDGDEDEDEDDEEEEKGDDEGGDDEGGDGQGGGDGADGLIVRQLV